MWRGKPSLFVAEQKPKLTECQYVARADPQTDAERTKENEAEWLVVVSICTHLGNCHWGKNRQRCAANMADGSAPVTVHTMTHPAVSVRAGSNGLNVPDYEF